MCAPLPQPQKKSSLNQGTRPKISGATTALEVVAYLGGDTQPKIELPFFIE
jgi:hypothetical protein